MGLSSKQVSNDHGVVDHSWGQTLLESAGTSVIDHFPKHPPTPSARRQNQQQQQLSAEALKCPRCGSANTKFCYYNNYNKSQPRHFCKSCKRHWTKGGTLRNVPVGGGRKNKRLIKTPNSTTATKNGASLASDNNIGDHRRNNNISDIALCRALMNNPSSTISSDIAINNLSGKNWMMSCNKNTTTFSSSTVSPMLSLPHQDQTLQFSFSSSLSPFDTIPCSFPGSNLCLGNNTNYNEYTGDHQLDHVDSTSTITTVTTSSVFSHSWQAPTTTSGGGVAVADQIPNYWNWNDVDPFVSSDINISWDEI